LNGTAKTQISVQVMLHLFTEQDELQPSVISRHRDQENQTSCPNKFKAVSLACS
jgi:hypothetical protein